VRRIGSAGCCPATQRTIENYIAQQAAFALTAVRERAPQAERFHDPSEYACRLRIPLVLLLDGVRG
jgi:hypothetical protein